MWIRGVARAVTKWVRESLSRLMRIFTRAWWSSLTKDDMDKGSVVLAMLVIVGGTFMSAFPEPPLMSVPVPVPQARQQYVDVPDYRYVDSQDAALKERLASDEAQIATNTRIIAGMKDDIITVKSDLRWILMISGAGLSLIIGGWITHFPTLVALFARKKKPAHNHSAS